MSAAVESRVSSAPAEKTSKRPSTAHFKVMPETRELRDRIRVEAARLVKPIDRGRSLTRPVLQEMGETLLRGMGLGEQYLGFTLVCLANEFWRDQVAAADFKRRLLLLPHCLKHAEGCPADYDEFGLDCRKCGACSVADFKTKAEDLGYKVLVSEGTPIVLKIIVSGHVDAIVGVACLNVLEKALDKVLLAGIPCVAAPLLSSNCRSTSVDDDWVSELIDLKTQPAPVTTRTYVHLLRAAHQICEEPELSRLAPRSRAGAAGPAREGEAPAEPGAKAAREGEAPAEPGAKAARREPRPPASARLDPLTVHENIAYDWLGEGGKRSRPFITLAVYDALKGGAGTLSAEGAALPDSVRRVALAIEAFHKASLVHDDIEDDDSFRYGRETLHRRHGISTAINVGDYLLGLGYRLVGRERKELGGDRAADILNRLADAHLKLSEGQGAELLWRDAADKALTPLDALKIYALKTSPAFEAALYAGIRLAGEAEPYEKAIVDFSKTLGVAFQILNDLKDWDGDSDNKLVTGQDVLAGRPTLLLALALEGCGPQEKAELLELLHECGPVSPRPESAAAPVSERRDYTQPAVVERVRQLFGRAQVFTKAEKLVEKYRARAEAIADEIQPTELRELLYYLVDSVLDRPAPAAPEPGLQLLQLSTP